MRNAFRVIIPARYSSSRLPGKPLLDIAGKTMIQRVVEQAQKSRASQIVVATDDDRIAEHVLEIKAKAVMTSTNHESGSDRLEEATRHLGFIDSDIIVNVQGDEPLIPPEVIDQVADLLFDNPTCHAATLSEPIYAGEDLENPNIVKVVSSNNGIALYFSRAPIPWNREDFRSGIPPRLTDVYQRHVGIYAYRVSALREFVALERSDLEVKESLEQLRFLSNGYSIAVAEACLPVPGGVDTPEDATRILDIVESIDHN